MIPIAYLAVGVAAVAAGGVAYAATRKPPQRIGAKKATAIPGGIRLGASKANTIAIVGAKAITPEPPARIKKHIPDFGVFKETHIPITLEYLGCETFEWGTCVSDAMDDAVSAGGAAAVASVIGWIENLTGLSALTNALCFRFEWNLHAFTYNGKRYWLTMDPLPIGRGGGVSSVENLRKYAPHPAPFSSKYVRAWIDRSPEGWYDGPGDTALTIYFPDDDKWSIMIGTPELRKLFRRDKIDVAQLGRAQCEPGRWRFASRAKAMNRNA